MTTYTPTLPTPLAELFSKPEVNRIVLPWDIQPELDGDSWRWRVDPRADWAIRWDASTVPNMLAIRKYHVCPYLPGDLLRIQYPDKDSPVWIGYRYERTIVYVHGALDWEADWRGPALDAGLAIAQSLSTAPRPRWWWDLEVE